jgi:hypothetical protein
MKMAAPPRSHYLFFAPSLSAAVTGASPLWLSLNGCFQCDGLMFVQCPYANVDVHWRHSRLPRLKTATTISWKRRRSNQFAYSSCCPLPLKRWTTKATQRQQHSSALVRRALCMEALCESANQDSHSDHDDTFAVLWRHTSLRQDQACRLAALSHLCYYCCLFYCRCFGASSCPVDAKLLRATGCALPCRRLAGKIAAINLANSLGSFDRELVCCESEPRPFLFTAMLSNANANQLRRRTKTKSSSSLKWSLFSRVLLPRCRQAGRQDDFRRRWAHTKVSF